MYFGYETGQNNSEFKNKYDIPVEGGATVSIFATRTPQPQITSNNDVFIFKHFPRRKTYL